MKIAVVADTHMFRMSRSLPRALLEGFAAAGVTRILHCGDFTEPEVADHFAALAPFDAVAGNNDGHALVERFGRRKVLDLAGIRIGLVHGDGIGKSTEERAWAAFAGEAVDAILFGHSHRPHVGWRDGILMLNPGSPTDRRREPRFSWGLLEVRDGVPSPKICYFDDKR